MAQKKGKKIGFLIGDTNNCGVGNIDLEIEIDAVDNFDDLGQGEGISPPFEFIAIVFGQGVPAQIEEMVVLFVSHLDCVDEGHRI